MCPDTTCVDLAERRRAFHRAFKAELTDGAIEALRARLVVQRD